MLIDVPRLSLPHPEHQGLNVVLFAVREIPIQIAQCPYPLIFTDIIRPTLEQNGLEPDTQFFLNKRYFFVEKLVLQILRVAANDQGRIFFQLMTGQDTGNRIGETFPHTGSRLSDQKVIILHDPLNVFGHLVLSRARFVAVKNRR